MILEFINRAHPKIYNTKTKRNILYRDVSSSLWIYFSNISTHQEYIILCDYSKYEKDDSVRNISLRKEYI